MRTSVPRLEEIRFLLSVCVRARARVAAGKVACRPGPVERERGLDVVALVGVVDQRAALVPLLVVHSFQIHVLWKPVSRQSTPAADFASANSVCHGGP